MLLKMTRWTAALASSPTLSTWASPWTRGCDCYDPDKLISDIISNTFSSSICNPVSESELWSSVRKMSSRRSGRGSGRSIQRSQILFASTLGSIGATANWPGTQIIVIDGKLMRGWERNSEKYKQVVGSMLSRFRQDKVGKLTASSFNRKLKERMTLREFASLVWKRVIVDQRRAGNYPRHTRMNRWYPKLGWELLVKATNVWIVFPTSNLQKSSCLRGKLTSTRRPTCESEHDQPWMIKRLGYWQSRPSLWNL